MQYHKQAKSETNIGIGSKLWDPSIGPKVTIKKRTNGLADKGQSNGELSLESVASMQDGTGSNLDANIGPIETDISLIRGEQQKSDLKCSNSSEEESKNNGELETIKAENESENYSGDTTKQSIAKRSNQLSSDEKPPAKRFRREPASRQNFLDWSTVQTYKLDSTRPRTNQTIHLVIDGKSSHVPRRSSLSAADLEQSEVTVGGKRCVGRPRKMRTSFPGSSTKPLANTQPSFAKPENVNNRTNYFEQKESVQNGQASKPGSSSSEKSNEDSKDSQMNDETCAVCHTEGRFICCESCPRSFHFYCLDSPISAEDIADDENWYCNICRAKKNTPQKYDRSIFSRLQSQLDRKIPQIYLLPKTVRDYFRGVGTNEEGEYVDVIETKIPRGRKQAFEDRDPQVLVDKHAKAILCYRCGKSAIGTSGIILCDHCPLAWHMDCLSPPLSHIPPPNKKWMCPNHSYPIIPRQRVPRSAKYIDAAISRGMKNNGNIEVDSRDEEETRQEQILKQIGEEETQEIGHTLYRLPEHGIKLDFLEKMKERNAREIQLLSEEAGTAEHEAIQTLTSMTTIDNLSKIVSIAIAEGDFSTRLRALGLETRATKAITRTSQYTSDEKLQLLAIQKLLKVKGKDKLVEFLLSN